MTWYRTGTAAFTNGNATVTGTGTAWIANASIGEGLVAPDGRIYEITAIASDTSLTISPAYLGSTASGQAYAIAPIRGRIAQLLSETSSLLASFATVRDGIGSGLFPDGTVSAPALRFAGDQDTGIFRTGVNSLAFATGGVQRGSFTGARFLVGPSSDSRLTVSGDAGSVDGAMLSILETSTGSNKRLRLSQEENQVSYDATFSSGPNAHVFKIGSTERLRIDSNGNVGIGTSSPLAPLHVSRTAPEIEAALFANPQAGQVARTAIRLGYFTAGYGARIVSEGNATTSFSNALIFERGIGSSSYAETMRIDASGNVGIGTSSPANQLDVRGITPVAAVRATGGGAGIDTRLIIANAGNGSPGRGVAMSFQPSGNGNSVEAVKLVGLQEIQSATANAAAFAIQVANTSGTLTERMRIDSNGNVGIGTAVAGSYGRNIHLHDPSTTSTSLKLSHTGTGTGSADGLEFIMTGVNGFLQNREAGFLSFGTSNTERLHITSAGIVRPGADNTQNLGEASFRWSTVFAGTGTINTSDEREKVWRGAMTEAEMRAAKRLLAELGMFQFTDSVEEKGEDARLHFGVRAQRAFAILEDEGLDWWRYAWCCHDKWDEITEPVMEEVTVEKTRIVEVPEEREVEKTETVMEPVIDEETGEQVLDENEQPVMVEVEQTFTVTETVTVEIEETYEETEQRDTGEVRVVREAGDRYGIRADQLAYWLIAAQAEIQNDLDARLAKLEAAQ